MPTLYDAVGGRVQRLRAAHERRARGEVIHTHVPTGLPAFDARFGGTEIGVSTLVVGHTGDGKTSYLAQMCEGAARAGFPVRFYVVEDPEDRVADRVLAAITGASANDISRLRVDPDRLDGALDGHLDWARNIALVTDISTVDALLEDLESSDARFAAVDYAQGLSEDDKGMERMVSKLCMGLGKWAKRTRSASALGSQVASEVLQRGRNRWERSLQTGRTPDVSGFRPGKGDAMWSKRLEQYSKAVHFVWRKGRWWKEMCAGDSARAAQCPDNTIEVRVGKQSYGPEGWETFGWDGATTRIGPVVSQ